MIETVWEHTNYKKIENSTKVDRNISSTFEKLIENNSQQKFLTPDKENLGPLLTSKFITDTNLHNYLEQFRKNKYKALFLGKNQLTDIGFNKLANAIKTNSYIEHIILSYNKIQFNEFAKAGLIDLLKKNRFIGWLVLNNNEIENKGAKYLALALKPNKSTMHLVLSSNKIEDEGLKEILISLKDHPKIESLFIANNKLTQLSLSLLIDFVLEQKTIKRIDISNNFNQDSVQLNQLKKVCDLKKIHLIF